MEILTYLIEIWKESCYTRTFENKSQYLRYVTLKIQLLSTRNEQLTFVLVGSAIWSWTGFQGCWIYAIVLFSQRYNCICACGELVYPAEYQVALVPCWTTREKENGGSEAGGLFPETRTPNYILWQWGGKGQCILRRYNRNRSKVSPGYRRWFLPNVYKHETGLLRLRWELASHALAVSVWKMTICQLFVINLLLCVCLFVCLLVCMFVIMYVIVHVCLSVCMTVSLFVCLYIYIYMCVFVHMCVC